MKKRVWRLLCVLAACALLCTTFCGCDIVDELRAANAVKSDDDTLEWNGTAYKRIETVLTYEMTVSGTDNNRTVYVNDDNVPVLLLPLFCDEYYPTENNVFLCYSNYAMASPIYDDMFGSADYSTIYYCREDRYDDVVKQLKGELKLTGYLYEYYNYETGEEGVYRFSAEEAAAFERVLDIRNECDMPPSYDYAAGVHSCTDDGLLGEDAFDIMCADGVYYIAHYSDAVADETVIVYGDELKVCYRVPEEYNGTFAGLMGDAAQMWTSYDENGYFDEEAWQ